MNLVTHELDHVPCEPKTGEGNLTDIGLIKLIIHMKMETTLYGNCSFQDSWAHLGGVQILIEKTT